MISESLAPFARRVVVAQPADTVASAARKLRDARVGCVVVVRAGRVTGLLTDRDIALRVVADALDAQSTTVEEIMTTDPFLLDASDTVQSAVNLMQKHGVRRLPIVEPRAGVLGIITADDLVASLSRQLAAVGQAVEDPADTNDSR
jgi:CBS domain-containing protein